MSSPLAQIALAGAGTYLIRVSMIIALGRVALGPTVQRALQLVAPAVLAALVVQTLLLENGELRSWSIWHPAAAVAAVVAWRTKSTVWTLIAGFGCVWTLAAIF